MDQIQKLREQLESLMIKPPHPGPGGLPSPAGVTLRFTAVEGIRSLRLTEDPFQQIVKDNDQNPNMV